MYVALSVFALGEKVPVPKVVHTPLPVVEEPFKETLGLFLHAMVFDPATTRGLSVILITIASDTGLHSPFPVVVSVMVTLPAAVSAALGVYVGFMLVALEKMPVPEDDQVAPVPIENEPLRETTALFAHTV